MLNTANLSASLPNKWGLVKLDNVCEILDRQRIPVNVKDRDDRIAGKDENQLFPYYGATGQVGWIDDYIFDGEYILLGEDGAPFLDAFKDKAYIVNGRFWVNNHAHILKSYGSNKFLCHYLNQLDYGYFVTGTTRLKLNQASMKQIPIKVPSLPEQHQIVAKIEELFSELDSGIENLKKARKQLKTYRQAVLKYAFEGKLTKDWRTQQIQAGTPPESAEKLLERIRTEREKHYQRQLEDWEKACEQAKTEGRKKPAKPRKPKELPPLTEKELAELPELPEGWGWIRVDSLCTVVRGGSPRPAGDPKYYGGKIPFLKVADITGNTTPYLKNFAHTIKDAGLNKTRMVNANTLLISNSGATLGVPKICLIQATFNDGIAAFLGLENEALLFHYYFWLSKTSQLRNINQGAAQPNLNTDIIANIPIPLCSRSEKEQIVSEIESRLSVCDQLEKTIADSLKKAEALRQSILRKAFNGELTKEWREKHPELISGENSALKLLERIKAEKEKTQSKKAKKK
jgi:type I restriction enzyme S subunit